jgi:hypothetical protein
MRVSLYGLAGVSYNWFKEIVENNGTILSVGDSTRHLFVLPLHGDDSYHSGWGFNTGAGVEAGKGHTQVFAEVRWNRWSAVNSHTSQVPLVIGVTFY